MLATSCASLLLKYSLMAATAVALYCTASAEGAPAVGLLGVLVDTPADTTLSCQLVRLLLLKPESKFSRTICHKGIHMSYKTIIYFSVTDR